MLGYARQTRGGGFTEAFLPHDVGMALTVREGARRDACGVSLRAVEEELEADGLSMASFWEALEFWAKRQPDKTAFLDARGSVSYAQMAVAADSLRSALAGAGVRRGDCVAAIVPNGADFAIALLASMRAGANLASLDTLLSEDEIEKRLDLSRPRLVLAGCGPHARIARSLGYRVVVTGDDADGFEGLEGFTLSRMPQAQGEAPRASSSAERAPALTIFTSGTTGDPKGVVLSEGNLAHAVGVINEVMSCTREDVFLSALPVSHVYGVNTGVLLPLLVGGTSVLIPKFSAEASLDAIERHGVSVFNGVPSMHKRMADEQEESPRDLSSMRVCSIAGARCADLERYGRVFGCPVRIFYGLTESPIIAATCEDDPLDVDVTGVGRFIGSVKPYILDKAGRVLREGEIGEVACESAGTMLGYLNDPEATKDRIDDEGRIRTGDLGFVDSAGYVHIVGRKVDVINRGGYKVHPSELEQLYAKAPFVRDCCVMGLPHEDLGQQIVLFAVLEERVSLEDVRDYAKGKVAKYKIPDKVVVLDKIPSLANGKPDKRVMMHIFERRIMSESRSHT